MRPLPRPTPGATVPLREKLAAGTGGIFETLAMQASSQIAYPILNIALGVRPELVGLALALPRLWDAMIDPFIGDTSDRTQSRYGRRRPHMFAAAILGALAFVAIWWFPRGLSPTYYFWHFLLASLGFFTASGFFIVPWEALLVELSGDYHERTRVQAARSLLATFGALVMPWLYWATQRPLFTDVVQGVRWVSLGVAAILLVSGLVPALWVRERACPPPPRKRIPLWRSLREAGHNRPFMILVTLMILFGPGIMMTEGIGMYVNIYHVHAGDTAAAAAVAAYQGTLLYGSKFLWVPVLTALATRWGKRRTLFLCFSLALVASALKWFCYTPDHPHLLLLVSVVQSPGMAPAWVLMGSMLADTVDWDEVHTGRKRAGLLLAVSQWMRKTGVTAAFALSGLILTWSGYEAARGAAQDPRVILYLRILFPLVPFVAIALAMVLLCFYPITEAKAAELRAILTDRRGAP